MIPRPGDYIVVRTHGIIATLIRLITGSKYNHAAIVADLGFVIEAEPGGVRHASITEYDGHLMLANTDEPTLSRERAQIVAYAESRLGQPYNWDADLADGLEHLGMRWRFLTRFAAGRKAVMCSQLVAAAGVSADLAGWQCGKPSPAAVVPGDLARRIERRTW